MVMLCPGATSRCEAGGEDGGGEARLEGLDEEERVLPSFFWWSTEEYMKEDTSVHEEVPCAVDDGARIVLSGSC